MTDYWMGALHVFVNSTKGPSEHGYTDSARFTVEADSELDAIVRAATEYGRDLAPDERIGHSMPWAKRISDGGNDAS